jgi:hypothetical protein
MIRPGNDRAGPERNLAEERVAGTEERLEILRSAAVP